MDVRQAGVIIENFLDDYASQKEFFENGEPKLVVQHVEPVDDGIDVLFCICDPALTRDDPAMAALAGRAMAALKMARPEVFAFDVRHEIEED